MNTTSLETSAPTRMQRIGKWVPGLNAISHYRREWLVRDLVARTEPSPCWVLVAELKDPVRDKIERYGLYETIDRRHFYPTIEVAIEEFHKELQSKGEELSS